MLEHQETLRLASFISIMVVMMVWETLRPLSAGYHRTNRRWRNNLYISVVNSFATRLLVPITTVQVALWSTSRSIGLIQTVDHKVLAIILAVVLLDLVIYLQHWAAHRFRWFWRLHRVHHSDSQFDVTTSVRFHPLEILISLVIKIVVIILIGAPAESVILFEVILSTMAVFNHANVTLPAALEPWVRRVFVTPSMHRIHHSQLLNEHNSNYGFNLSIWDRLFRTYTDNSATFPIKIGLDGFKNPREITTLLGLLKIPFR
jgi:sterol desaturase/sphingolipid hydroxylase (fatty acid hydroxylase superfamily)